MFLQNTLDLQKDTIATLVSTIEVMKSGLTFNADVSDSTQQIVLGPADTALSQRLNQNQQQRENTTVTNNYEYERTWTCPASENLQSV